MYHLRSCCELEFSFIHLLLVLSCSILNHFLTKISLSLISSNLLFCRCGPTATWEGLHLLRITGSFQSPIERSWGRNLRQEHGGRNKSRNNGGHCLLACSWASSQVFLPPRPTVWGWPLPEKDRFCYINKQYFFFKCLHREAHGPLFWKQFLKCDCITSGMCHVDNQYKPWQKPKSHKRNMSCQN